MADILRDEGLLEVGSFQNGVIFNQEEGPAFSSTPVTLGYTKSVSVCGSTVRPKLGSLTDKAELWPSKLRQVAGGGHGKGHAN